MDPKERMRDIMSSMSQGRVGPLFDAMAEDVSWRWMGVSQWSRTFEGKQLVVGHTVRRSAGNAQPVVER